MSQFDSLLDLGDTGTTEPAKQSADDPFDPYAAQDSNVNGNSGGDLLDLGFDMQVSSQSGNGKISLEANTNPLYELSNNQSQNIMESDASNPLYEISNDTYSQDLKLPSANPLYDFIESEDNNKDIKTNGHTEDLLGTTDSNEVDLLGNSGPITSDDSGVTMETNNFEGSSGEIIEEHRTVESSEDSDTQGKAHAGEIHSAQVDIVNGTSEAFEKDQTDKGPMDQELESGYDQGSVEQNAEDKAPISAENISVEDKELVDDSKTVENEPDTTSDASEGKELKVEQRAEAFEDQIPVNDDIENSQNTQKADQGFTSNENIMSENQAEHQGTEQQNNTENQELEQLEESGEKKDDVKIQDGEAAVEPVHDKELEPAAMEKELAIDEQENKEKAVFDEQLQQEDPAKLDIVEEHFTREEDDGAKGMEQCNEEIEPELMPEEQKEAAVHDDADSMKHQTVEEQVQEMHLTENKVNEQSHDEVEKSEEQAILGKDSTEHQQDQTDLQDQKMLVEPEPEKSESKQDPIKQEPFEPDEEPAQPKQTQKETDSSTDKQKEGALKVNGTSEENDLGAGEEETVRDPNIYRETREKEEVHFTELSNVRQRFESGASGDGEPAQRKHSVKDDYDKGGEFESTPIVNPDTVKETDETGEELPSVGMAANLLAKFQQLEVESAVPKPSEKRITPPRQTKVEYESTPKERLEQYEGKSDAGVFESQPKENIGIIKSGEQLEEEPALEKGHAKSIASKYKEIEAESAKVVTREKKELTPDRSGKVEYVSEPRGESIANYDVKTESGVFESTPKVEEDVVRADEKPDEILPEEGMAKNILSKFKQLETEMANRPPPSPLRSVTPDRTKKEFVSGPRGYLEKYEGKSEVIQGQPLEVVKSDEVREEVMPEAGSAKKQMERFKELEKQSSSPVHSSRKEFTPPRESSPGKTIAGVLENTPTERLEGVVKSTDVYDTELPEQGMAKNIASKFKRLESESSSGSPGRGKKEFTPPPEAGVYENIPSEPLVVEQRKAESGVLESTPSRNPDIAREHDQSPEVELPERGYAKNMVSKFRQLESESAKGSSSGSPQKYKEFTPPRDTRGLLSPKSPAGVSDGVQPSELPGQYQQQVKAGVFENEPEARPDLAREADTDWSEGLPAANTAMSMKQRFQEMENKALKELETPPPISRKEKGMIFAAQPDKCSACEKTVYAMEKLEMNKNIYHKGCFKCSHCSATLTAKTFSINEGVIFCTTHFKQLFARKGNYDEGFGRQQYKKKWTGDPAKKSEATA